MPIFSIRAIIIPAALALPVCAAYGQEYPSKPIRIIASEVGGGGDFVARLIAPQLASALGQPVIVENRPSAIIRVGVVSKAPADGYTLLLNSGSVWIGQLLLREKSAEEVVREYAPITLATIAPNVLTVHPSLPVKSVKELLDLARSRPGALNYASSATGGTSHLAAALFANMAGINITRINYKGSGQALNDLIGGHVQMMFPSTSGAEPYLKSGRLRGLAVTSAKPSVLAPGLPTVAASGVPGYESVGVYGMLAPARTPGAIIDRLNREIVRFLNMPDTRERLLATGVETVGGTPDEFSAMIQSDIVRLAKMIKDAGIRGE
jgi:tripartite-type tricarboxylate transporter receptor subunit TctC